MKTRYLPTDPRRKIVHLMEEAAEVIHACAKLLRFGDDPHPVTGKTAKRELRAEIRDLRAALRKVEGVL